MSAVRSTAAASTAPATTHGSRTAASTAPSRPALRVVAPPRFRAPRGPFVLVVGAVLTLGLLGVLGLNTLVAQDAFALGDLRARSAALADREQALMQQVAEAESPARLERRARALGMVPSVNPVFLRLADGAVLGVPAAPSAPRPATPVTPTAATTPTTATTPTAAASPAATGTSGAASAPQAVKTKRAAR